MISIDNNKTEEFCLDYSCNQELDPYTWSVKVELYQRPTFTHTYIAVHSLLLC